jgi:lipid II:glycine glycyltransferase (peptidoglycan interpeptide bridge formation enzyme)
MQGMIRIWGNDMQVFDGNNWMNMGTTYATVDLNGEAQSLLQWAREQKAKQSEREDRIKKNPALQKAYDNIKRAEENFDLIDALVKDYIHSEVTQSP